MTLGEYLIDQFDIRLANTPSDRHEVYRLRFQVYCQEHKFLDPRDRSFSDYVDEIERDEFDARAVHCLVFHRQTQKAAGCVRIVTAQGERDQSPLPLEKFCAHALSLGVHERLSLNRDTIGEVSRFAVAPSFRKPLLCSQERGGFPDGPELQLAGNLRFSLVTLATGFGAIAIADMLGLDELYAMMSPAFLRLLRRSGVNLTHAGQMTEYSGKRLPCRVGCAGDQGGVVSLAGEVYGLVSASIQNSSSAIELARSTG